MYRQQLIKDILHIDPAAENCREQLLSITEKYPYFSLPYYFLLQRSEHGQTGYNDVAARTALHFNSALLLHHRLQQQEQKETALIMPENAAKPVEPVADLKTEMLFEPLSATDYFASQGIKLSEEVQSGDKLGKQLKSFTEWLKTMKKVHGNKLPEGNDQVDIVVQKLAEKSNEEGIILTESMAEAYIQQGKHGKAKEIYEKLSLLNPSKSVYFAAKIESLGTHKSQVTDNNKV